ncbi:MAG TPA: hypothetical protein VFM18_22130 [Methanosarcina sp.]|nr:hypothetical protein [Methanosarcina sp.]
MGCENLFDLDTNDVDIETLASVLTMNMEEYDWDDPEDRNELLYGDFGALHLLNQIIKVSRGNPELRQKFLESEDRPLLKKFRVQIKLCSVAIGAEKETAIKELFDLIGKIRWTLEWGGLKHRVQGVQCYGQEKWEGDYCLPGSCFSDCKYFPRDLETGKPDRNEICQFWIHLDYLAAGLVIVTWDEFEKTFRTKIKVE